MRPEARALGADAIEQALLRRGERFLMSSGVTYTILRPDLFIKHFSTGFLAPMLKQGGIWLAVGDAKTRFISTVDIAAEAAVAVQREEGREYNLTGPEALDHGPLACPGSLHHPSFHWADCIFPHERTRFTGGLGASWCFASQWASKGRGVPGERRPWRKQRRVS